MSMAPHALVIGIGNADRGDDGVGLLVARELALHTPPSVAVIEHEADGAALLSAWQGYETVMLVDAMPPAGQPGRIRRFAAHEEPLPADLFGYSTHAFGVAQGVELARQLGQLPPTCIVYGIEGEDFAIGAAPTAEVVQAAHRIATAILAEVAAL